MKQYNCVYQNVNRIYTILKGRRTGNRWKYFLRWLGYDHQKVTGDVVARSCLTKIIWKVSLAKTLDGKEHHCDIAYNRECGC